MATHSSIIVWKIPWTEEPGGLQVMGLQTQTWLSDWKYIKIADHVISELGQNVSDLYWKN